MKNNLTLQVLSSLTKENGTFIVDENNIIQHVSVNALDTGRNAQELLRTLQAVQYGGLTGCDWQPGEDFVA